MNSKEDRPSGRSRVELPVSCTLKEAAHVKGLLKDGLELTGDVELDARGIGRIDTTALQLLVSFVRDMSEAGRAVTWIGPSEEFTRSARTLGLTVTLGVGGST